MIEQEARPRCTAYYRVYGELEECRNNGGYLVLSADAVEEAEETGDLDVRVWCAAHTQITFMVDEAVEQYHWPTLLGRWRETEPEWVAAIEAKIRVYAMVGRGAEDEALSDSELQAVEEGEAALRDVLREARAVKAVRAKGEV